MEPENVSEKMDEEARRVAAAFGIGAFELVDEEGDRDYRGELGSTLVQWTVDRETLVCSHITLGWNVEAGLLEVWPAGQERQWELTLHPQFNEIMARGLYRLGFEDESILSQLPVLSAHEKTELRLSMPREFWPKSWLADASE